jgi:hypothetical protein
VEPVGRRVGAPKFRVSRVADSTKTFLGVECTVRCGMHIVKNVPVNYAMRCSGPVTGPAWRPNKSMQNIGNSEL